MNIGEQALACECLRQAMLVRKSLRELEVEPNDQAVYAAFLESEGWKGRIVVARPADGQGGLPANRRTPMRVQVFGGVDEGRREIASIDFDNVSAAAGAVFKRAAQFARPRAASAEKLTI